MLLPHRIRIPLCRGHELDLPDGRLQDLVPQGAELRQAHRWRKADPHRLLFGNIFWQKYFIFSNLGKTR